MSSMGTEPSHPVKTSKPPRRKLWLKLWVALIAGFFLLLVAAFFIPVMDGPNRRQHSNEASAVGTLRRLNTLESNYAATHPVRGFTCELRRLQPAVPVTDAYETDEFWRAGVRVGYKFVVSGCEAGPRGVVMQYQVTATPLEPGKSGFRAFCTDQTGALWYDPDGSAEKCLASRRPIW